MAIERMLAVTGGALLVAWTLFATVRTFILPRAEPDPLVRFCFIALLLPVRLVLRLVRSFAVADRVLALYAPCCLVALPVVFLTLDLLGFAAVYHGGSGLAWEEAVRLSGSSLLTLGSVPAPTLALALLSYFEAAIGLVLVALLIAYLPSIYASFSERESQVSLHAVRVGVPASGVETLIHFYLGHAADGLRDLFAMWERWFVKLEETHTTHGVLALLRSPVPERSWLTTAGAILDAAALALSALDVRLGPHPTVCLNAGVNALASIAGYFHVGDLPSSGHADAGKTRLPRAAFDTACSRMQEAGLPVRADRATAFADFRLLRARYERPLLALAAMLMTPPAPWSSDLVRPRLGFPLLRPRGARRRRHLRGPSRG